MDEPANLPQLSLSGVSRSLEYAVPLKSKAAIRISFVFMGFVVDHFLPYLRSEAIVLQFAQGLRFGLSCFWFRDWERNNYAAFSRCLVEDCFATFNCAAFFGLDVLAFGG